MTLQSVANKTRPEHLLWATDVHTYNTTGKKNKKKKRPIFYTIYKVCNYYYNQKKIGKEKKTKQYVEATKNAAVATTW